MATGTGAKSTKAATDVVALAKQRATYNGQLPDPRVDTSQLWSKSQEALKGITEAQMVMLMMESEAFQQTVQPLLDRIELERAQRQLRKRAFLYTVAEVERAMIFKAITGINLMKDLRKELSGDDAAEIRRTLGFDTPRDPDRRRTRMDGVPSEATLCRHRQLFYKKERAEAYGSYFELTRDEHIEEFPVELLDELRLTSQDGSKIEIQGQCPYYRRSDTEKRHPLNEKRITCPDGGYVPPSATPDHSGHGFNKITIATVRKLPMVFEVVPLNESEKVKGAALIDRFADEVLARFPDRLVGVINMDGGFHSNEVRKSSRRARLVENLHKASHADTPSVELRVAKLRQERIKIKGNKYWKTDGLCQLICKCGRGSVTSRTEINRHGGVTVRAEGVCKHGCGTITITSGLWKKVKNPTQWVKANPQNPKDAALIDWAMGNPLTYDDLSSTAYGRQRRSEQEGLNSVIANRMGLTKGKRRYTTIQDARADVAIAYALAHLLTMIQRRADAANPARSSAPPLAA